MTEEPPGPGSGESAPLQPPPGTAASPADETATSSGAEPQPPTAAGLPHVQEISQQNIKNRLNEVITEIEREVERELDCEESEQPNTAGSLQEAGRPEAQEADVAPTATPQTMSEPCRQSALRGQLETGEQLQPQPVEFIQSLSSAVGTEQNSHQSNAEATVNDQSNPQDTLSISSTQEHATSQTVAPVMQASTAMASTLAQTEPTEYESGGPRFTSPYGSTATSSLPRGWPGSGGVAFALSGHPTPPEAERGAVKHHWTPPTRRPHDQWKTREMASSPYATLPRMANMHASGMENHPKRVHFADTPEVQTFDNEVQQQPEVVLRPRQYGNLGGRPVSAPAATQMFTIPNMAARPYGRTSPLLVTPARRGSPPPAPREGRDGLDACVGGEQMSPQPPEQRQERQQEQETEPSIPPAPPVQKTPVPPSKIFTPAQDVPAMPQKKKTMFVDSAFFSPKVHPTWEQQVEMAKRISSSLSDASNKQSKGQSMYERRKKRSVKWVHGGSQSETEDGGEPQHIQKEKPLLQLLMNPHGHVYDLNALRKEGWIIDNKGGLSPEICSDLIKDLNSPTGKGAQIFAKRKKRAEKWVVDEQHREARKAEHSQVDAPCQQPKPSAPQVPQVEPSAPQPPPQPVPASQQAAVEVAPVPLQTLYQPPQAPQFPSGGVYAPRTAHSWSASQEQTRAAPTVPQSAATRPAPPPAAITEHTDVGQGSATAALSERQVNRLSWTNYNTAPRGWGNQDHFYRPVTFTQPLVSQ